MQLPLPSSTQLGRFVDANFFLLSFSALAPLAACYPTIACSGGLIRPEITVFYVAIMGVFFLEGLSLPTGPTLSSLSHPAFHLSSLFFNFFLPPALLLPVVSLPFFLHFPPLIRAGFLALSVTPSTTSMSVMLSSRSGGLPPLAACAALLSNLLGALLSPLILQRLTLTSPTFSQKKLAVQILVKMVPPLLLGQGARALLSPPAVARSLPYVGKASQILVLLLLFQILSDVFASASAVSPFLGLRILSLVTLLHYSILSLSHIASAALFPSSRPTRVSYVPP
jgi:sodium/bile acid cotransporter 7